MNKLSKKNKRRGWLFSEGPSSPGQLIALYLLMVAAFVIIKTLLDRPISDGDWLSLSSVLLILTFFYYNKLYNSK